MSKDKNQRNVLRKCCEVRPRYRSLIARTGCSDDIAAVAALPDKWVPRHAGPVFINYMKEQEHQHKKVSDSIVKEAALINETIDSKIRKIAEALLAHIKQNEFDMNCVVDDIDIKYNPVSPDHLNNAFDRIAKLYAERTDEISNFKHEASLVEKLRADEIRKLLQLKFQNLVKVGHLPPRDLLHEFDQRAYEVNQQILSNSRAYIELEAQLSLQADEFVLSMKSNLNQLSLGVVIDGHRHSTFPWQRDDMLLKNLAVITSDEKKSAISVPAICQYIDEVEEFDECVSLIVHAYRAAVMKVFSGFSGKLSDLHSHLGCFSYLELEPTFDENIDVPLMIEKILKRLSISINESKINTPCLAAFAQIGAPKIQKSLWSLGERLRDTYKILHDTGHLGDSHMVRVALAQKLTITCVEDLSTNNDSIEQANEVNHNLALEQLKSASDIDKLQQQYEAISTMLGRINDMYNQHNESEIEKLENFMNFPESLSKILMSEFHCFLEKHPRTAYQIINRGTSLITVCSPIKSDTSSLLMPLPRAILQTELQEIYLSNWRNGFLETFETNINHVPQELKHHAQLWVDERARALRMRHSLKLMSHSIRKERLKAARDNRMAELKHHETRLESHLNAVYDLVNKLPNGAENFLSLDAPQLYPFCDWIDRIQTSVDALSSQNPIDIETKKMKMCSYAPRLYKHRDLFEKSLDVGIECGKSQVENRIQEARISNIRFMSQLKLFSEGGRYSAQEATRTCAALTKAADALEVCLVKSTEALNLRRSQILMLADQKLGPLQKIVEEFAKSGNKGGGDKRKVPTAGKKK
jgi:hypothetical protein